MGKKNSRNSNGAGTIRKRNDGTWEARYTTGIDPGTGKQIQRSVYGKTQKDVRQKLTAAINALDKGSYFEPNDRITVGQWLDKWLETYVKDCVKPYTYRSYETAIRVHIKPAMGVLQITALNTPLIQDFYKALGNGTARYNGKDKNKKEVKPLSAKTIKNIHGALHKALQKAVELHYISYNPAEACTLPRIIKPDIKPLDEQQSAAFLAAIEKDPYRNLFFVTLFSGLRRGEVMGLRWNDVNFATGTIIVRNQLQQKKESGGQYYFETPKNSKSRVICLADFAMDALRDEKKRQIEAKLLLGGTWSNPNNLVFTKSTGENLAFYTVYNHFKKIAASVGVPDARFHDLRHTYAVTAIQAGDDIKTVQETLGHATASFTLDVYGHVTDQMKRDSANRMQATIERLRQA